MVFQYKAVSNPQSSFWLSSAVVLPGLVVDAAGSSHPSEDEHMATAAGPAGAPACLCLQNAGVLQGTECWQGLAFGGKGEE